MRCENLISDLQPDLLSDLQLDVSKCPLLISFSLSTQTTQPTEDPSLVEDNRKLRDELALLRQELMQVKEEGLKKRISKPQTQGPTYGDSLEGELQNQDLFVLKNNTQILFFALIFFVIGVIFGKILI